MSRYTRHIFGAACAVIGMALAATPSHAAGTLAVHVKVTPTSTVDGKTTRVTATTKAGAQCRVEVLYHKTTHAATSKSLEVVETAGAKGTVTWTWKPATHLVGPATATVTCHTAGASGQGTAHFSVTHT